MELKTLLRSLIRKWWLILPIFVVAIVSTYVFTINQIPIYETATTLVMRPRFSDALIADDEIVKAIDTLSRRIEINTTYAEVAKSKSIKRRAIERLDLSSTERKGLSVQSKVIAGTNVLEITARGPDPIVVRDFVNAVSAETRTYISNLYDTFQLEPLDGAEIPKKPINSNTTLNLVVSGILALILGVVMAYLLEYFLAPTQERINFDIIDHETGAYNRAYFKLRLHQEMSRAKRNGYAFSLALLKLGHHGLMQGASSQIPTEAWRRVTAVLGSNLRDEDELARFDDTTFALLLPDLTGKSAAIMLEELRIKIGSTPLDYIGTNTKLSLQGVVGIVGYEDYDTGMDELLAQATFALRSADSTTYGAVYLFSKKDSGNTDSQNGTAHVAGHPRPTGQQLSTLTKIKGIGPARQRWLRDSLNVRTFGDLAALSADEIEMQLKASKQIVDRSKIEHWIEAAQELTVRPQSPQQAPELASERARREVNPLLSETERLWQT